MALTNDRYACPACDSSDGLGVDTEGNAHCFSCKANFKKGTFTQTAKAVDSAPPPVLTEGRFVPLMDRGITMDTCKKYGIKVDAEGNHSYPYTKDSVEACIKHRTPNKSFPVRPSGVINECDLFGQRAFAAGGPTVTITEGELDAASAYQMLDSKYPAVSVQSSSSALKDCKRSWKWLNSFRKIIIAFDNDEPGKKAAQHVAQLFPGKAFIMSMSKHNDPNDYLKAKDKADWMKEYWNAKEVAVGGFLLGDGLFDAMAKPVLRGASLPWPTLDAATYGVRMHECWTLGSGSGMGKTEVFKELAYHMATVNDSKCGIIFLEESPGKTGMCVHGKSLNTRLQKPEYASNRMDMIKNNPEYEQIKKNLIVVDHKGESDLANILSQIEYLVVKFECKYIFLDHITAICEGKEDGNVNSMIHHAMEELNKLLQRHEFSIFLISHLNQPSGTPHEEGARVTLRNFYGSGAIKQRSNFVFGLEGNQQEPDEFMKNRRLLRCLKDRELGEATGLVVPLQYGPDDGRLPEYDIDDIPEGTEP